MNAQGTMGREKCGRLSVSKGKKRSIFIPVVTRTRFFFFLEFPQPPGGVMTRRTVFTRQIITVESVFARSDHDDWLLYP